MDGKNKNSIQNTSRLSNVYTEILARNPIALITTMTQIESISFLIGLGTSPKQEQFHSQLTFMFLFLETWVLFISRHPFLRWQLSWSAIKWYLASTSKVKLNSRHLNFNSNNLVLWPIMPFTALRLTSIISNLNNSTITQMDSRILTSKDNNLHKLTAHPYSVRSVKSSSL